MSDAAKGNPGYRSQDKGHKRKPCIDCVAESEINGTPLPRRKAPYPGPRCHTHSRLKKNQRRDMTREQRWERVYSISADQYWAIYEAQNGCCAICQKSKGLSKKLSVDHDHSCCSGPTSCGNCVRSLLCTMCNRFLGHIGDSVEAAQRMVDYLVDPPGRRVLDNWED
ncbi:endonuclease VII [Mycobacterium phage MiaZeal]|uniref:endonuclease VII n=1 Tax=Mycobacterium phage MiaZeal TaxID=1567005 RepID=UPI0005413739|nr:endonuclease VII [Mycobacterium phage MiaZeal]AIY32481.1 endonuclease VII [Mycobacterium phage MiaZeal]